MPEKEACTPTPQGGLPFMATQKGLRTQPRRLGQGYTTTIRSFTLPIEVSDLVRNRAESQEMSQSLLVTLALRQYFANRNPQTAA